MIDIVSAAGLAAGKALFKNVVSGLYEYCQREMKGKLEQWTTERQMDTLFRRISIVRKVKTIWQVDKAVDLMTFYCDSHVLLEKQRKKISKLSDFGVRDNILIQGIAGQGKSIVLRYLCANELCLGKYIPLFIELRRISSKFSLQDRIIEAFRALHLSVDEQLFRILASSGKMLLLLDAFDEVPDELKSKVLTDIEDLSAAYDNLRIVVTSRPYQDIQFSNHFIVVTLDNLKDSEYALVIRKLASRQTWAKGLVRHIEEKASHIKDLLCTPLMVTLLVLSYKSYQKLPTKLSDFYDALFQTLLQRHDGTKPGFTRQRRCALDDNEYRQVFECLCILVKKKKEKSLTSKAVYDLTKESLKRCGHEENAEAFVDDMVKITCLIIRDGEECRFIHRTVQEYYAASYIQKQPDPWIREFYGRIVKIGYLAEREWGQELEFLSEIDEYRYNRYYALPSILKFLDITEEDLNRELKPVLPEYLASLFDNSFIVYEISGTKRKELYGIYPGPSRLQQELCETAMSSVYHRLPMTFPESFYEPSPHAIGSKGTFHRISINHLMREGLVPDFVVAAQEGYSQLFEKARNLWSELKEKENPSLLDGLI
jgi:hypothetical protein